MDRETFSMESHPRRGIIEAISKQAPKHAGREVLMCFTSDPYQHEHPVTRKAIELLKLAGCCVTILTKGGLRSAGDLELLRPGFDKYGATLTFVNSDDSSAWEPNAALPAERIEVLAVAKGLGIQTWASIEPVIDPEQSIELIKACAGIVDLFKIGRWNHDKRANDIDWHDFAKKAIATCESQGSQFMLKKDLACYLR
jgi:DNA repair photolyase